MTCLSENLINFYGYEIPSSTSEKSKIVIQTLAECGCVEVICNEIDVLKELLSFAKDYGIKAYKEKNSFILCDNPVRKVV
jgi:hypothetical protein